MADKIQAGSEEDLNPPQYVATALVEEIKRLRALIKEVEETEMPDAQRGCPWCGVLNNYSDDPLIHRDTCRAFYTDGRVR